MGEFQLYPPIHNAIDFFMKFDIGHVLLVVALGNQETAY
jgi:hypothetical protein